MATYAVITVDGPAWDSTRAVREQEGWDGHAAFMDGLVDDGFVIIGGPLGDHSRRMLAVSAEDEDEVLDRLAADPWAVAGLLRVASVETWELWLDSRVSSPPT